MPLLQQVHLPSSTPSVTTTTNPSPTTTINPTGTVTRTPTPTNPSPSPSPSLSPSPSPSSPTPTPPVSNHGCSDDRECTFDKDAILDNSKPVPQFPQAASPSDSRVVVSWNKVNGAVRYKIYLSKRAAGSFPTPKYEQGSNDEVTNFDLDSNATYRFYVSALFSDGRESPMSNYAEVLVQ